MNRRYIREAAVVGLYQYFLNFAVNIDCFELQMNGTTLITRQMLRNHKKEFDLSHYNNFFPKEELDEEKKYEVSSKKKKLQQFLDDYNTILQSLQNRLTDLQNQIKIDTVIFIQLLHKLKKNYHLQVNEEIYAWLALVDDAVINNLEVYYQDFWVDKNGDIDQIGENILKNVENIKSVQDFVAQVFLIPKFYEHLEFADIEWENNITILKKKLSNTEFLKILAVDENFESYNKFYLNLVNFVLDNLETINDKIKKNTLNWDFERISLLDKSILSLAIGEFFYVDHLPKQIIINEYLEISKRISKIDSSMFINGILDKVLN
ncbi:MAG: transcription antitermination protein NusB [Cytophagales bacterium]|jgi:transcription antitermination factor NusB|nr:transcription antitermination protein NusB [Cytophagales bacterium]